MIASAVESFVQVDVTVTAERVVQGNAAVVPAVPVAAAAAAAAVAVVVAAAAAAAAGKACEKTAASAGGAADAMPLAVPTAIAAEMDTHATLETYEEPK